MEDATTAFNTLIGGNGNDTLVGGHGVDSLLGGGDDDYLDGGSGDDVLRGEGNSDMLYGGDGNDALYGGAGNDTLSGDAGDDTLDGGAGLNELSGGAGSDTYIVRGGGDQVSEYDGYEGTDTVWSELASYTLADGIEDGKITLAIGAWLEGNDGDNGLAGNAGDDTLVGGQGNDTLDGLGGLDLLQGGGGDDTYHLRAGATVAEGWFGGTDTVVSYALDYTLGENIENAKVGLETGGRLTGDDGANVLAGNIGADTLDGGLGDDVYVADASDTIIDAGGDDTVESTGDWTLASGLENVRLAGVAAVNATGNAANNRLQGNAAANTLDGAAGADTMAGGAGDDRYRVDDAGDIVQEQDDEGIDTVEALLDFTLSDHVERLELGGSADINGTGNALANAIVGNAGDNILDGGAGADTLSGGAGNDIYLVDNAEEDTVVEDADGGSDAVWSTVDWTLGAHLERLALMDQAVSGTGNALANVLMGNAAGNVLDGGAGADTMAGGEGDDTYFVDDASDDVAEDAWAGWDVVVAEVDHALADNVEELRLSGLAVQGTGNAENNVIEGNALANVLDGGLGSDGMYGGLGDDTYFVDDLYDFAAEEADEGTDTVVSTIGWVLGANLENLTLAGTASVWAGGNELANLIRGNAGDNALYGDLYGDHDSPADTLEGGAGNDTYYVRNVDDVVVEAAGQGNDTVISYADAYTLGDNVEIGRVGTSGGGRLTGSSGNNTLYGNYGADFLAGAAGNDTLSGGAGIDTLEGGAGDDMYILDGSADVLIEQANAGKDTVVVSASWTLAAELENLSLTGASAINGTGNAAANVIIGNLGRNILNGAAGADTMKGEGGDDTYKVDNAGDVVVELASQGTDLVETSVDRALEANVENMTAAAGTASIDLTGNTLANVLTGNAGANILNGGAGADTMAGGLGNDTYYVDNAKDDISGESSASSGGIDLVYTTIDWSAASDYVENVTAAKGTAAIDLTGNKAANVLTGNDGKNILNGGAGADKMAGGKGNDTYYVDNAKDDISGESSASSGGIDTVISSVSFSIASDYVEQLLLTGSANINGTGNTLANLLAGNSGKNVLNGGSGKDTLDGGAGADTLTGGSSADRFVYDAASDSTLKALDKITDFTRGSDKIDLSHLDGNAGKSGHQDFTFIGSKAFSANATGQLRFAVESGKVMLYGSTDADSAAEFAVHVSGTTTLSGSDFLF